MKTEWSIHGAVALLLLASGAADAQMRCGTELIVEGDAVAKLLATCGEPATGELDLDYGKWTYNFGPLEFMHEVTIADGKVVRIEKLGKGFIEDSLPE